jgi:hypothetical protein
MSETTEERHAAMMDWRDKRDDEDRTPSSLIREALHDFLPEIAAEMWSLVRAHADEWR